MGATQDLARYVVETPADRIPDAIIHEGKRCLINFLAVALYASRDPSLDILLDVFGLEGGSANASVLGSGVRTSLQNAALANGYLGHLEDYDDTHFPTVIHPSSPTLPAALALGEQLGSTGWEVLAASVLGMELCCRIGMAVHPYHYDEGWHITGTCGVFGAAAASGRLLGMDADRMAHALGVAGAQASGLRVSFGSMTKPLHPGRSAQSGVLAALLASRGFTSTTEVLEGRRGFAEVYSAESDLGRATDRLGDHWELYQNGLKPYACGVVNHPLIDAMVRFRDTHGVTSEMVAKVRARVHPLVLELVDRPHPRIGLEGKFSYQHSMAVGLVDGAAFPAQYTDERVADPEITRLRGRITATVDGAQEEGSGEVTVVLTDGRELTEVVDHATGTPENPLSDAQLEDKFRALAGRTLSEAQVERALSRLWALEELESVGELFPLLRAGG
jgi:2-methylcitrate dehydratase PrpD